MDAVLVACDAGRGILPHLGLAPCLVVSGPNYGPNISGDVYYRWVGLGLLQNKGSVDDVCCRLGPKCSIGLQCDAGTLVHSYVCVW